MAEIVNLNRWRKVKAKEGEILTDKKIFDWQQEILKLYQKAGLQKTKVEAKESVNENLGRATVIIEITEAPKVKIADVVFDARARAFRSYRDRGDLRAAARVAVWIGWDYGAFRGEGVVAHQEPAPGAAVEPGGICRLQLSRAALVGASQP